MEQTKKYDNHNFIYKYNKIENIDGKLFDNGYVYHTHNRYTKKFNTNKIFPLDDIQKIILTLENDNKKYKLELFNDPKNKINFISDILLNATKDSKFDTLIYYYLQIYKNNFDKIIKIELEIDDMIHEIDYRETIENIYNNL